MTATRRPAAVLAIVATPLLLIGLAACAPEPGTPHGGSSTPGTENEHGGDSDGSWGEKTDQNDPSLKQVELPESFPSSGFSLPEGAVINDAGERGAGAWFVVLQAKDAAQADDWWQQIVDSNGFKVSDDQQTSDGGRSATLSTFDLTVSALTVAQADGSVLLSYDLRKEVSG